ncbi:hypothetical protein P153DRAFT_94160 [Dothidotthia symphoricarpi CBS 119687]|uniref:Uncharacterized protein n=1 Tax=Dothidotthia symphoricarpi CBS 119687 TaxID=1392245 RepID=A0A6A6A5C2_9PLEO|nr:uncharacterized protein P153DRAFT_94160 [Dothidotthia symphoricarpi CBS 119687]KAF2125801.1 hypothetical protein P153DRAFT_94160 [Dothidotthia symphoricarpi CBS 119687]
MHVGPGTVYSMDLGIVVLVLCNLMLHLSIKSPVSCSQGDVNSEMCCQRCTSDLEQ